MAFNTAPGRAEYTASAAQTKFTFAFKIFDTSDVKVYLTPAGQTADDTADILIETTDYTIAINGDNGGDVDLTSGASLNDSITLVRELPTTRTTEYQQSGDLTAQALNEDQDYQTYLILDGVLVKERALTIPDSVQSFDTEMPSPVANKLLVFNGDASGFDLLDPASTSIFKDSFIVDSIAALGGVDPNVYSSVIVRGYYVANDGGGGLFNYDATQSAVNNGGTVIDGWVRQYDDAVMLQWFGIDMTGAAADSSVFQSVLDNFKDIDIGEGEILLTGTSLPLLSIKTGTRLRGRGKLSNIKIDDGIDLTGNLIAIEDSAIDVEISNFEVDFNKANQASGTMNGLAGASNNKDIVYRNLKLKNCQARSLITNANATIPTTIPDSTFATDIIIDNVTIEGGDDKGIQVRKSDKVVVSDCISIIDTTDAGNDSSSCIEASMSSRVAVSNAIGEHTNLTNPTLGPSFRNVNGSHHIQWVNCIGKGGRQGIFISESHDIQVTNGSVEDCWNAGILILNDDTASDVPATVKNITVTNFNIKNPDGYGVRISGIDAAIMENVLLTNMNIESDDGNMLNGLNITGNTEVFQHNIQITGNTGANKIDGDYSAIPQVRVESVDSSQLVITNQNADSIDLPQTGAGGIVEITVKENPRFSASFSYRGEGASQIYELSNADPARTDLTTGVLTGTTGTDTNVTYSIDHVSGKLYIENRVLSSARFSVLFKVTT